MRIRGGGCAAASLLSLLLAGPAVGAITGVCPDGSIFIVQNPDDIPCRQAKRVDPSDVPPIQPDLLPRPYGWERFHRRADPNNPYNVIDAGAGLEAPQAVPEPAPRPAPQMAPQTAAAPLAPQPSAPLPPTAAAGPLELGLTEAERSDLMEIVKLMQSVAPATVSRLDASGARRISVRLAHSPAFEGRLHQALARRGSGARGAVLLILAEAHAPEPFHGHLTFVQGHLAFHPDRADPEQLGLLAGGFGELQTGQQLLGYVVLPEHLDAARPLDVYWNDLRVNVHFPSTS